MRTIALILVVAFAGDVHADEWTWTDTAWQASVITLQMVDCSLTLDAPKHYPEVTETNPLLGRYPSKARIRTFCAANIVGTAAVARVLPSPWRRYWQAFVGGVTLGAIQGSVSVGLRLSW